MNNLHDEDEESKEKKVDIQQNTAHSEDLNEYKTAKTTSDDHPGLISNEEIKIPEDGYDMEPELVKGSCCHKAKKSLKEMNCCSPYNFIMLLFEGAGVFCYIIGLTGCAKTQTQCLLFLQSNALFIIAGLLMTCCISYCLCAILVCKNKIHWLHILLYSLFFIGVCFYDFGADIGKHGAYNFCAFVLVDIILFIIYGIVSFFYNLLRKKRYITFCVIIGSIFVFSLSYYLLRWRDSCKNWYKGMGGKSLINDPETDGCYFDKPNVCTLDNLDGLLDCSKIFFRNCHKHEGGEKKLFLSFINETIRNGTNFAYPSSLGYSLKDEINVFNFNKDMLDNVIDVDRENPKTHHEIVLSFNKKNQGIITIDVQKNETLVKEREEIRKKLNKNFLYKNILFIYIDAFSRNHFLRKMKETKKFIEKYLYDSSKENTKDKVSFQFFKYHSFSSWTHISIAPMFYGETMTDKNGTNLVKYFKENGYITGMTEDYCSKELFDVEKNDYNQYREWVDWDHENVAMFCDPNYHNRYKPYPTWKGPYSFFRRCLYGKDSFEYALEYTEKFWEAYIDQPKFFRLGFIDAHEGTMEVIKYVDSPLNKMLNTFNTKGWLKDTAIYFVSDHGTNMVGLNEFISPDYHVEKYLASFFLILPNSNDNIMQNYFRNIETNSQKMITPFDIHDTLMYMLYYDKDSSTLSYSKTGQTVFEIIDAKERVCSRYRDFERGHCICKPFPN